MKTNTGSESFETEAGERMLLLTHPKDYPGNPFESLERGATRYGITVKTLARPMAPQMGVQEWLLPAIVVGIAGRLAGAFLGEMGKDLYIWFKKELFALWEPIYGPSAPKLYVVTSKGIERRQGVNKFGIMARTANGTIALVLPERCSHEDFTQACEQFIELFREKQDGRSALLVDADNPNNYKWGRLFLAYDSERKTLTIQQFDPAFHHSNLTTKQDET